MKTGLALATALLLTLSACQTETAQSDDSAPPMKALIIDGQNNHGVWPMTTAMMQDYLEANERFTVDVVRTATTWQGPHSNVAEDDLPNLIGRYPIDGVPETTMTEEPQPDPNFAPDFSSYDVVLSNFGWNAADWPDATKRALEAYVSGGGGLVIVHAADNSFGDWDEYNKMIGLGGWGDRDENTGPWVYYNDAGELVRDTDPGGGGSHGKQHEFVVMVRDADHPITSGMPTEWKHTKDELYGTLRGPAENMKVLATAYSDTTSGGSGRHEPMMMAIDYGSGRVFHTPMGHMDYSMESVGFITTLQRGAEWAATGDVMTEIPADFPTMEKSSARSWTF